MTTPALSGATVWEVARDYGYEGESSHGIFSSEEKAWAYVESRCSGSVRRSHWIVRDWTVDGALSPIGGAT